MRELRTADDVLIRYYDSGDGRPLLFLHGLAGNYTQWIGEIEHFEKEGYRIIAPDLRGCGGSDAPPRTDQYSMERMARDVLEIMDANDIREPPIISHSMGGMISLKMLELRPRCASLLVLVSAEYMNPLAQMKNSKEHLTDSTLRLIEALIRHLPNGKAREFNFNSHRRRVEQVFGQMLNSSKRSDLQSIYNMIGTDMRHVLHGLECPCLVVGGENDHLVSSESQEKLAEMIKDSEIILVEGQDHAMISMKADLVSDLIAEFLDENNY